MTRSYDYICLKCGNTTTRPFRVPSIVRSCENDCGFDHYLRTDLLEKVKSVPTDDRPDDWEELDTEQKVYVALREGVLSVPDLQ